MLRTRRSAVIVDEAVKPEVINRNKLSVGGVDDSDKSIYHVLQQTYQKILENIFTNFLELNLLNAYPLYERNTDKPLNCRDFIVIIVGALVDDCTIQLFQLDGDN